MYTLLILFVAPQRLCLPPYRTMFQCFFDFTNLILSRSWLSPNVGNVTAGESPMVTNFLRLLQNFQSSAENIFLNTHFLKHTFWNTLSFLKRWFTCFFNLKLFNFKCARFTLSIWNFQRRNFINIKDAFWSVRCCQKLVGLPVFSCKPYGDQCNLSFGFKLKAPEKLSLTGSKDVQSSNFKT